jgi:hypothetical protein
MRNKYLVVPLIGFSFLSAANISNAIQINLDAIPRTSPVQVFLEAGTYSVDPIGVAEGGLWNAWSPWNADNCYNTNGCPRTYPSTYSGWFTDYIIESDSITSVSVAGVDLAPIGTGDPAGTDFFLVTPSSTIYWVRDTLVYSNAVIAQQNAKSSTFTISQDTNVTFLNSRGLPAWDDRGGLSLAVNLVTIPSTVPLPPTIFLFTSGLLSFLGVRILKWVER